MSERMGGGRPAGRRTLIVGGGTAGSVLAARLSEDPERTVILVEAGPAGDTPPELLDGATIPAALPGHPANWAYESELMPGRAAVVPRGRLLGGSSTVNGGYFVRARPGDFARWAEAGGSHWRHAAVLPLLAALEDDLDFGSEPGHGDDGPMRVQRPPQTDELPAAFTAAARELGFPVEPDKNALGGPPGVGPVPSTIVAGVRVSTAAAYLRDAASRPNLTILGDARVARVLVEGGRAVGVELLRGASRETKILEAAEVVLCAGATASAQLLMLSGIGPSAELAAAGIPVLADLPVGEGFHDHPNLALGWHPARPPAGIPPRTAFPTALNFDSSAREHGPGQGHPDGDLEILLTAQPDEALFGGDGTVTEASELRLIVALQQPRSRGRLTLRSADPLAAPRIEYRYLEDPADAARLREGVRVAAAILRSEAFAGLFGRFASLDPVALDEDGLLDAWIREHLGTAIHMCGTAAMGRVVDGGGSVRGIAGLRVADTSILPTAPSRGPFNTAVLIGELIARLMRAAP